MTQNKETKILITFDCPKCNQKVACNVYEKHIDDKTYEIIDCSQCYHVFNKSLIRRKCENCNDFVSVDKSHKMHENFFHNFITCSKCGELLKHEKNVQTEEYKKFRRTLDPNHEFYLND